MKLPLSLIRSFVELPISVAKISETLTLLGIEVDHVAHEKPTFSGVVAAEVTASSPHPNAERLKVAQVYDGKTTRQVVCGGANCRAGIRVAFAQTGAILKAGGKEPIRIEPTEIRGVPSAGMLCAIDELDLEGSAEGILELPHDVELGSDLAKTLWDPVFELSLTPNLGHCFSALGIARELSAALQLPLRIPKVAFQENGKRKTEEKFSVSCETQHCQRYMGRYIENVKIGPSPFWLQQLLYAAGMKPINNAVDITNYILLKWGQPMHAFDAQKLEGNHLKIVEAKAPHKFLGLDKVEREVPQGALLILDKKKPVAVAGIIGGENSAVSEETTEIFLECAIFDPLQIRKASRKMGLRTESSHHFEKGVDPVGCAQALEEAIFWIEELTGGAIAKGAIDLKQGSFSPKEIKCRVERVNQILGLELSQSEIEGIFQRLGFKTHSHNSLLRLEVPLFRNDISEEIDLIEEVARIYGYNNIPKKPPRSTTSQLPNDPAYCFENEVRQSCIGLGLQETLNADLISPKLAAIAHESSLAHVGLLKAIHSKSEEYSILRPSLLPGLLQVAKHNFDRKNNSLALFEIGRIHFQQKNEMVELPIAAILLTGQSDPLHWSKKLSDFDFYDLKGILENLCISLKMPEPLFQPSQHLSFHPGRQADLLLNDLRIGSLGEVHPSLTEKLGIEQRILFAEIHLQNMLHLQKQNIRMKPLPQFPASERDWTGSLPLDIKIEMIFQTIRTHSTSLLEKVELIDLYYPEGTEQKNATFRFTYRDLFKTISFEEVEAAHQKLLAILATTL